MYDYEDLLIQIPVGGVFVKYGCCYIKTDMTVKDEEETLMVVCVNLESGGVDSFYESESVTPVCADCKIYRKSFIEEAKTS